MSFDQDNSVKIRCTGVVHKGKSDKGANRYFYEAELGNGQQQRFFSDGNDNISKWLSTGKSFFGQIKPDETLKDSQGREWTRVWRDWNKKADGSPREAAQGPQGGGGGQASTATEVTADEALAAYKAILAMAKDAGAAAAVYSKLDIRVPYAAQAPEGFTPPPADDDVPF